MTPLQGFCKAIAMASQWHCTAIVAIDQKESIEILMVVRPLHCHFSWHETIVMVLRSNC